MTGIIVACCCSLLLVAISLLRAAHRAHQWRHRLTAQEALASMDAALDADIPQRALLRVMARLLVEQERAALVLETHVRALLPEAAMPGPNAAVSEGLAAVDDLARRLQQSAGAVSAIEASVMGLLDQPEPREVVSAFIAERADLSRDALARAQFVHVRDHIEQVADTVILQAALRRYDADISADAVRLFARKSAEYADPPTGLHTLGSARQAAKDIFSSGVSTLPVPRHAPSSGQPSGGGGARGRPVPGPTAATDEAGSRLRPDDVFAFSPVSPWWPSAMAYLPLFGFVAEDLRELSLLDETWARLQTAVQRLLLDVTGAGQPGDVQRKRWPSGPPSQVIGALIGQRIASIVRARWLAWTMSDCHRTLMEVLAETHLASRRLAAGVSNGMAQVRSVYLAEIGRVPRLDATGAGMADIAARLQESGEMHVQVLRLLLADAGRSAGSSRMDTPTPNVSRLLAAVRIADQAMTEGQAALSAGSYLEAVRRMLDAQLPLSPDSFPGLTFYRGLLAEARPMAVLAATHRLAVARWAAMALNAFFQSRQTATEMISQQIDDFRRTYDDKSLAVDASLTLLAKGKVLWRKRPIRTGPNRRPSLSATA